MKKNNNNYFNRMYYFIGYCIVIVNQHILELNKFELNFKIYFGVMSIGRLFNTSNIRI
jgi:hypothetical protein